MSVPFIPETAPFSSEQRAWLNGFLVGVFSNQASDAASTSTEEKSPLLVMFGTQTGTAETLSRQLAKKAKGSGFAPKVVNMEDFSSIDLTKEKNLLLSTPKHTSYN